MSLGGTRWLGAEDAGVAARTMMMVMMTMGDPGWLAGCQRSGAGCCRRAAEGRNTGGELYPPAKKCPQTEEDVPTITRHPDPKNWGDPEPSPAPGHTPPSTAARRAGRRRRRPGLSTAGPGGHGDAERLGDTVLSPTSAFGGPALTLPGRLWQPPPRRSGAVLGQAGVRAVKLMLKWVPQSNICWWGRRMELAVAPVGKGVPLGRDPPTPAPTPLLPSWRLPAP